MMDSGQLLRQAREAQELSLADVEEQTRIRQRYLAALESGDWDELPNEIVGRGFLRKYADFLGLDIDELLAQDQDANVVNADAAPSPSTGSGTAETPIYRPIDLDLYETTIARPRLARRALAVLLALIPVALLAYLLVRFGLPLLLENNPDPGASPPISATLPPAGTAAQTPLIVLGETPQANASATPLPAASTATATLPPTFTPTPLPTHTPTATPVQQLSLEVRIEQRAWTQIVADGEVLVEGVLNPGENQSATARERLEWLTGNAAGVTLVFNGEILSNLGEPGEIISYIWTLEAGQVTRTTPTPTPVPTATPTPTGAPATATVEAATVTVTVTATSNP